MSEPLAPLPTILYTIPDAHKQALDELLSRVRPASAVAELRQALLGPTVPANLHAV